jgi:hypothetical protein
MGMGGTQAVVMLFSVSLMMRVFIRQAQVGVGRVGMIMELIGAMEVIVEMVVPRLMVVPVTMAVGMVMRVAVFQARTMAMRMAVSMGMTMARGVNMGVLMVFILTPAKMLTGAWKMSWVMLVLLFMFMPRPI